MLILSGGVSTAFITSVASGRLSARDVAACPHRVDLLLIESQPAARVLRSVVRRAGIDAVRRHWPGTEDGFAALCRLTGIRDTDTTDQTQG